MSDDPSLVLAQREAQLQSATAEEWLSLLRAFVVETDAQQEQIVGVLRDVKSRYKDLEDKRTEITKPLNQALRAVNGLFHAPKQRFEELEKLLKAKVAAYLDKKSQANTAALQAAAVAPTPELAQQAIQTVAPVAPPQGVSVRHVWKFEVTDANAVPREFCSPDEKKIKAAFELGMTDIPGVKFFQEAVVSARSG
jgi:hypothetical protein